MEANIPYTDVPTVWKDLGRTTARREKQMQTTITEDVVLQDFLKGISTVRPRIGQLILFGSRARGTHRFDSDYDVLVIVSKKDESLLDVLYESVMDVILKHGRLVSLKVLQEQEFARLQKLHTPFMKHIQEEGIPIGQSATRTCPGTKQKH